MSRDVGKMGEAVFRHWCASLGLTANPSLEMDKTGWDFLVEFDFDNQTSLEMSIVHQGPIECKVQIKSTDKRARKLPISLSNLRRLVTSSMPAFIVFIEFDGSDTPQRTFLVHIDQKICAEVLKRLHDAEQNGESDRFHKKTMTIRYDDQHQLSEPIGQALAQSIGHYVGPKIEAYTTGKIEHLSKAGFENGFAEMTFMAEDEDTIQKLIDMSLGIECEAEVSQVEASMVRFGKRGAEPFLKHSSLKIGMMDVKPNFSGAIKFRTDKLGASFAFPGELYVSQFNNSAPEYMQKARLKADFFDLVFNPNTNAARYTFIVPDGAIPIRRLRDGLRLRKTLSDPEQLLYVELDMPPFPEFKFTAKGHGHEFDLQTALGAAEAGIKILSSFDITNDVKMSLTEAVHKAPAILELEAWLAPEIGAFKFTFTISDASPTIMKEAACVMFHYAPIGNIMVGAFITAIGQVLNNPDGSYTVLPYKKKIDRILVREKGEAVDPEDLIDAGRSITEKYKDDYIVATLYDEDDFRESESRLN